MLLSLVGAQTPLGLVDPVFVSVIQRIEQGLIGPLQQSPVVSLFQAELLIYFQNKIKRVSYFLQLAHKLWVAEER